MYVQTPVRPRKAIAKTTKSAAPELIPRISVSASGLRPTAWISVPDRPRARPTSSREDGAGDPQVVDDPLVADVAIVGDGLPDGRQGDVLGADRQAGHARRGQQHDGEEQPGDAGCVESGGAAASAAEPESAVTLSRGRPVRAPRRTPRRPPCRPCPRRGRARRPPAPRPRRRRIVASHSSESKRQ